VWRNDLNIKQFILNRYLMSLGNICLGKVLWIKSRRYFYCFSNSQDTPPLFNDTQFFQFSFIPNNKIDCIHFLLNKAFFPECFIKYKCIVLLSYSIIVMINTFHNEAIMLIFTKTTPSLRFFSSLEIIL